MIAKLAVVLAVFAVVQAGQEPPPPKVHTYNVPVVSKVSYPGPAVTRQVETYSAPSIEKTTTITRSVTAPLNAPAERQVFYAAPTGPVGHGYAPGPVGHAYAGGPVGYAGGPVVGYAGGPVGFAGGPIGYAGGLGFARGPIGYAPIAHGGFAGQIAHGGYAGPIAHGGYAGPIAHGGFAGQIAHGGYAAPIAHGGYAGLGQGFAGYNGLQALGTTFSAPALGYSLGGPGLAHGHSHGHAAGYAIRG